MNGNDFKAFVSSTFVDLKDHRAHVISALRKAGIFVDPMEDWTASSEEPKKFGTKRLEGCDLCILLVAFRRGHVPEGEQKSITQMEYNAAKEKGIDVLVYMLDEDAPWPRKFDELDKDPQMRPWRETLLEHRGVTLFDLKPDSIDIGPALFRWKNEKSGSTGHDVTLAETYLTTLLDEFKSIEVRGVKVSDAQAHRLDIEKLYTPLHITGSIDDLNDVTGSKLAHRRQTGDKVSLDKVLKHRAAVIIGDPGAGKSTFLKRIVTILCRTWLGHDPGNSSTRLGLSPAPFPVFVRLFDLASHIRQCRESGEKGCPSGEDNPAWVFHYLGSLSTDRRWGLTREWFERQCDTEEGIAILLDGLDETPDKLSRNNIIKLVNKLKNDRPCCRLVVTSRPVAFEESVPLRGFYRCDIASLDDEGVNTFIRQWCDALYFDTPEIAKKHFEELRHEVFARAAIRRMAANPVMLTALAVVHWNNKRLPEQRAELYESVIGWLLDSRDMKRPGRIGRDECREHLQMIALSMQSWKGGRQQSLERGEMIDLLAKEMSAPDEKKRRSMAEKFIEHEELDSGIIRASGNRVEFWHLTFLEYLAARELAGIGDESQRKVLLKKEIIDDPNWRETLLLFIGVLWSQGRKKVEGFFGAMLDNIEKPCGDEENALTREARCFGLMGAMLRDLQPYDYHIGDNRFGQLQKRVEEIFEAEKAESIGIKIRIAAADALGQAGDHRIINDLSTQEAREKMFVEIPEGEFLMGAQKTDPKGDNFDEDAGTDEGPVRRVQLSTYRISRYPVTVAQYERFVNEDGYERQEFWKAGKEEKNDKPEEWEQQLLYPNRPVTGVSWFEVKAFCSWANLQLPTEAQWERAARGPGCKYRKYPWGNEEIDPQRANYRDTEIKHCSPVGCFPSGNVYWDYNRECWLTDMAGNVWEWCSDWFKTYPDKSVKDTKGPESGSYGVLRGGSWNNVARGCRCASRYCILPGCRFVNLGFRVVFLP